MVHGILASGVPPLCGGSGDVTGRPGGGPGRPGGAGYRWASAIDLIYRIKMVVSRASGTDLASSLKQNKFWMRVCVSVSVSVCVACPGGPPPWLAQGGLHPPLGGVPPSG